MKFRSIIIALIIVLTPFIVGIPLFLIKGSGVIHQEAYLMADTRKNNKGINYKGIKVDWTFCPDWKYKPLFFPAEEYLVFMFHYRNDNEFNIQVMPSYTFASPHNRRYSENALENKLKAEDQTPITFEISPNATKHYIVTFEKPHSLDNFYVDVDVFRDVTLRLHYKKEDGQWNNYSNELVRKYKGRG
jgi:hypothetical protein